MGWELDICGGGGASNWLNMISQNFGESHPIHSLALVTPSGTTFTPSDNLLITSFPNITKFWRKSSNPLSSSGNTFWCDFHSFQQSTCRLHFWKVLRSRINASFSERNTGSLEIGKKVDLVILNGDIMSVAEEDILRCRVVEVLYSQTGSKGGNWFV